MDLIFDVYDIIAGAPCILSLFPGEDTKNKQKKKADKNRQDKKYEQETQDKALGKNKLERKKKKEKKAEKDRPGQAEKGKRTKLHLKKIDA
jgi:hypothetical protein